VARGVSAPVGGAAQPEAGRTPGGGGLSAVAVSISHGSREPMASFWLTYYSCLTPGCESGSNATWLMLEDAPQPDCYIRILPEYGGQSSVERRLGEGAPELIVEVSRSSAAHDLGSKLRLYRAAGVREYINVLLIESRLIWRRLVSGTYQTMEPNADGLPRSIVFPGLWLDPEALWERDVPRIIEVVNLGW